MRREIFSGDFSEFNFSSLNSPSPSYSSPTRGEESGREEEIPFLHPEDTHAILFTLISQGMREENGRERVSRITLFCVTKAIRNRLDRPPVFFPEADYRYC